MIILPSDVLCLIFSQLVQSDQLECMTVCRRWHDTILHRTLFRVIYIDRQEQLNSLIEKVKRDPLIGTKVDSLNLNLYMTLDPEFDGRIFIKLFPNLREFQVFYYSNIIRGVKSFKQHETQGWRKRMKKIKEDGYDRNTYRLLQQAGFKAKRSRTISEGPKNFPGAKRRLQIFYRNWRFRLKQACRLLQSGVCKRLTVISVCGIKRDLGSDFIKVLTNAPALKELTMENYYIYIQDLELLHSVVQSIETLSLIKISLDGTTFPRNVKPVTTLRNFKSDSILFYSLDETNLFAQYISQKYTRLEEMEMEVLVLNQNDDEATRHKSIITSHLKTLGPRLKTLIMDFRIKEFKHPKIYHFNILDECECQLKRLELRSSVEAFVLEQLSMTTQVNCIQSLTVNEMFYDDNHYISLDWLGRFRNLKELKLHFPYHTSYQVSLIELLDILENIQLESLTLCNLEVDLGNTITAPIYSSLKALTVVKAEFKQSKDVFVSHSFPNLKRLKLQLCGLEETWLMLPNLDLSYLEITDFYKKKKKRYVLLTTLDNNQRRLYSIVKKKVTFEPYALDSETIISTHSYIASKPYDASEEIPSLMIVCKSLHNFFIYDSSI